MKEKSYRVAGNYLMWQGGSVEIPSDLAVFLSQSELAGRRFSDAQVKMDREGRYMYIAYWGGCTGEVPDDVANDVRDALNGIG